MSGAYRALLRCYPAAFRAEYGDEMTRLFAERWRRAGAAARAGLLLEAAGDTAANPMLALRAE